MDLPNVPSTPPLFGGRFGEQRSSFVTAAVAAGFGDSAGNLRAPETVPGMTWRSAVLGATVPKYQAMTPTAVRGLIGSAQDTTTRALDKTRELRKDMIFNLPSRLGLVERLPEELFLEMFNLPDIIRKAALTTWDKVTRELHSRYREWAQYHIPGFWQDVRTYLDDAQVMRQRLLSGGLLPSEWHKVNVWVLGALGVPRTQETPSWLQALRRAWKWIQEYLPFLRKSAEETPLPPETPHGLHSHSHFHLFGLELETYLGDDMVARSTLGRRHQPGFLFCPQVLPPGIDPALVLTTHAASWQQSHRRRQQIYYWSGRIASVIIDIILKYIALGPVGLVIVLLNLLAEGVVQVIRRRKGLARPSLELTWPSQLPGMEVA